jgi:hypothetical protein
VTVWRFSWRAIGAWLASALVASAAFGLVLTLLDLWTDPSARNPGMFAMVWAAVAAVAAVGLIAGGGLLLVAASLIARCTRWPRPALEIAVLAAACFAVTNIDDTVTFNLDAPQGQLAPLDHPAAFITAYLAPPLAGALMGWLYWRFAGRPRAP